MSNDLRRENLTLFYELNVPTMKKRKPTVPTITNRELETILKAARMPTRSREHLKAFPKRIAALISISAAARRKASSSNKGTSK